MGLYDASLVELSGKKIQQNSEKMLGFKMWLKGDFGSFNLANYRFLRQNCCHNIHVISSDLVFPLEILLSK